MYVPRQIDIVVQLLRYKLLQSTETTNFRVKDQLTTVS